MKKTNVLAIALLATLFLASIYTMVPVKATKGPRSPDCDVRFYANHEAGYAALVEGSVDFIQWSLTYEQRMAVEDNPNIAIAGYDENGLSEFDFHNNYTIATYPGVRNPLNDQTFRQALTCMVDKQFIIDEILVGAAGLLNVPICSPQMGWANDTAIGEAFPYRYNETKAEELLTARGFVDTDDNGKRNYPDDWETNAGEDMHDLMIYVRTEDKRLDAGRYLADQLDLFDIPYDKIEGSSDVCFPIVMGARDYHIYTGGWSLGRYPTYLDGLFHSRYYFPDGSNYVTGNDENNEPNYPELDPLVKEVYFAPSKAEAEAAAKKATGMMVELCINCPLWSYKSFVGWRKTMPGVVNMKGYGYDNSYQFLNAYNTESPIKMGTIAAPKALNPLYSTWYYDYAVMDRFYNGLLTVNPYNLAMDQPAAVQDWEVGTWEDPHNGTGEPKVKYKLTYYLRKDVGIVNGTTGAFVGNLNAHDLEFSCWYTYSFDDCWNWGSYEDVHHTRIVDPYTIEIYFEDIGWLFYSAPQYPILAKDEVINKLCTPSSVTFTTGALGIDAQLKLDNNHEQIVQVTSATGGLVEGEDFIIFGGYEDAEHNWIWFPDGLAAGTYTINYKTPLADPHGYYLAGLGMDTWYAFGPYYPVSIVEGVGGYAVFNRNPYFWLETPLLGEIDWMWQWADLDGVPLEVPGPDNPGRDGGYFEITIYDVVRATAAYCHSGTGPYDPDYFPGADIEDADLGHVGITDIDTVLGAPYGAKFGQPPA